MALDRGAGVTYLAVLPSIWPSWTAPCLESSRLPLDRVLVVDNTETNRGVAASWNLGVEAVLAEDVEWLLILSAAMRFGQAGALDFVRMLEENPDAWALEAAPHFGWHCIAFHRRTLEGVGLFDENFWPGYWEDNDYAYRFALLRGLVPVVEPFWRKVALDAEMEGYAHGVLKAGVNVDSAALLSYYELKWGGLPSAERYSAPFGDASIDLKWWPRPPDPRSLRR